ncbi:hypothetical protein PSN45_000073 [Yamadazyma tenuis]|uniref:Ribosomal protein S7 n=1 Tax=Candida tenuis (strain ATCC 10573 / BCRC 21748 / CBS 615 / JCM 9827 / NBRC 10315 / NRRL Y-1498 / VKM Y-70) TaxID=590646 RepID=G3BAB6_CANTC|nr:ribosomal protein S7 [Yamadazyma tenuis ATCC 10573]XP_006688687.1 uncharacterized protein CANTEDRAFT_114882 [Yamadazyma tenuis ATCC 10573]EGV62516.1 ribosomal protein S7 [Yamadazyma tenuis ATCC 10573]EGV62517.1 hypothetical protein CANTEDRAFT_114882 [Yamadazyma tenuis ATCC 10573]WEJ92620.1 hypothetical protein PSN45_000073 [Yamadazyma tenuis]
MSSIFRLGARTVGGSVFRTFTQSSYRAAAPLAVRFKSSPAATTPSLTAQIFPMDKDTITEKDVDEWIQSLQRLKNGHTPDNATEIYIDELTRPEEYLKQQFEASEQQLQEQQTFETARIPLASIPVVDNVVNLIMRNGKKSQARKIVARALYLIYLKMRVDPVIVLEETLEKLGPLTNTKVVKTGHAKNIIRPYPLNERQRRRYAILWILDGAAKKKSSDYSVRLAEEIMSAHAGKSSGYEKKASMHKVSIAQRAYINI